MPCNTSGGRGVFAAGDSQHRRNDPGEPIGDAKTGQRLAGLRICIRPDLLAVSVGSPERYMGLGRDDLMHGDIGRLVEILWFPDARAATRSFALRSGSTATRYVQPG